MDINQNNTPQTQAIGTSDVQLDGALIIDVEGLSLSTQEVEMLKDLRVSGVIFFARNFESIEQIETLVQEIRSIRPNIILYVDQEGGRVQRFKKGLSRLPALKAISKAGPQALEDLSWLMAKEILALGIDISFTPVLDIDYGRNEIIGDRAFGKDAQSVITAAEHYLNGLEAAGMAATGKHFPGHGFVTADSHLCLPVDERPLRQMEQSDILPFKAVHQRLGAMMTAHIHYEQCDSEIASYSSFWIEYLRVAIGFQGLVFSDDLVMEGAQTKGGIVQQAHKARSAGCDLLLICNDPSACIKLLEDETQWESTRSLAPLKGELGKGFADLRVLPRYQEVRETWNDLFKLYE